MELSTGPHINKKLFRQKVQLAKIYHTNYKDHKKITPLHKLYIFGTKDTLAKLRPRVSWAGEALAKARTKDTLENGVSCTQHFQERWNSCTSDVPSTSHEQINNKEN